MARFGEKFSKLTSDTKKQAQVIAETNRLNAAIRREEDAIQAVYTEIGKQYFETCRDDGDAPQVLRAMMDRIANHLSRIGEMRARLLEIRGVKTCPGCGAEAQIKALFCSNCGHGFRASEPEQQTPAEPQPVPQAEPQPVPHAEPQPAPDGQVCRACGQPLAEGMKFCGHCGHRQQ